jgi:hypothetical protein
MVCMYKIFNISNSDLCLVRKILSKAVGIDDENNWEIYDDCCKRYTLQLDDSTNINTINKVIKNSECVVNNDSVIHYIKYDINNGYKLNEHSDGTEKTIIIYLDMDYSLDDKFYVGDVEVSSRKRWEYGGLIMHNNALHSGEFTGSGKRDVLCIFI